MPSEPAKRRRQALTSYAQAGTYVSSGFQFAGSIAAGLLAGWWLDSKLKTEPAFLVAGTILGAISGFYYLFRTLVQPPSRDTAKDEGGADAEENGELE